MTTPPLVPKARLTLVSCIELGQAVIGHLPVNLGADLSIEDLHDRLESLSLWQGLYSPEQLKRLKETRTYLVHRNAATPGETYPSDSDSGKFLAYVLGHLRLLAPCRSVRSSMLHGWLNADSQVDVTSCSQTYDQVFVEDFAVSSPEFTYEHIGLLKSWVPWICKFKAEWKEHYPLYLSMFLNEKAYLEDDLRTRHLFRVMAIEALFGSDTEYGKKALVHRVQKFLGWRTDLFASYRPDWRSDLPVLPLTDTLIEQLYDFRNKIAHGDSVPDELTKPRRQGLNYKVTLAAELSEAATAILTLAWRRILAENLQPVFADKQDMRKFFAN